MHYLNQYALVESICNKLNQFVSFESIHIMWINLYHLNRYVSLESTFMVWINISIWINLYFFNEFVSFESIHIIWINLHHLNWIESIIKIIRIIKYIDTVEIACKLTKFNVWLIHPEQIEFKDRVNISRSKTGALDAIAIASKIDTCILLISVYIYVY